MNQAQRGAGSGRACSSWGRLEVKQAPSGAGSKWSRLVVQQAQKGAGSKWSKLEVERGRRGAGSKWGRLEVKQARSGAGAICCYQTTKARTLHSFINSKTQISIRMFS